jgi:NitT/TauT family transport system substrate-binding protein
MANLAPTSTAAIRKTYQRESAKTHRLRLSSAARKGNAVTAAQGRSVKRSHWIFSAAAFCSLPAVAVRAQSAAPLRMLTLASDVGALAFYAQETGAFGRAGLNVEVSTLSNGAASMAAVAGGAAQIGQWNAGSVAQSVLIGLPFTIIVDGGLYENKTPTSLLLVKPNSGIKTAKDLAGKTIAVNALKGIGQAAVEAWLEKNGVGRKSVSFVEVIFPAMPAVVESGRADACFVAEPSLSAARDKLQPIASPYDAIAPEFSFASYTARSDWLAKNRSAGHTFAAVMQQTAQWANTNPDEAKHILAKHTNISESVIATMARVRYATTLQASHLQPSIDVMARFGYLSKRVNAADLITRV